MLRRVCLDKQPVVAGSVAAPDAYRAMSIVGSNLQLCVWARRPDADVAATVEIRIAV